MNLIDKTIKLIIQPMYSVFDLCFFVLVALSYRYISDRTYIILVSLAIILFISNRYIFKQLFIYNKK